MEGTVADEKLVSDRHGPMMEKLHVGLIVLEHILMDLSGGVHLGSQPLLLSDPAGDVRVGHLEEGASVAASV
jgi:hypothetical protein